MAIIEELALFDLLYIAIKYLRVGHF